MFQDCLLYYSASFDDVFVPCTPSVAAERQSYMAAMTVNYIKECKEFNFQLPFKLPVEPPLGKSWLIPLKLGGISQKVLGPRLSDFLNTLSSRVKRQ